MIASYYLGASGSETIVPSVGLVFSMSTIEVGRKGRTMSGKLVQDITTTKKVFTMNYSKTIGATLTYLNTLYAIGTELNLLINDSLQGNTNYKVLMNPFNFARLSNRSTQGGLYSFSVSFEEV